MTFFSRLQTLIQLSRPVNVAITLLSVFIAAFITGTLQPLRAVLLACISAGLIAAAANTINDFYDLEIDRINKPRRPLPAGKISPAAARAAALAEFALGNLLASLISPPMFLIAAFFSLLTYLYAAFLKRTVLWGNFAVSLTTAAAFFYGGTAVNRPAQTLIPAAFAFFFHFGREIIKDMEDVRGDSVHHARTFPIRFGMRPAIALVWVNFITLMALTLLPFAMGWYGPVYFIIVAAGLYPVIFYTLISLLKNTTSRRLGFLSALLKADMVVGLLAIYFR